jgi:hypothetical protein
LYDPPTLTILINLDHALVSAALGDGHVEDTTFRRLSYEIAFSEYAMGLGYEISKQDPNIPADAICSTKFGQPLIASLQQRWLCIASNKAALGCVSCRLRCDA